MNTKETSLTVYALIKPAAVWKEIPLLIGFNLLLAASAYISIELPFSPVPITGQSFGILLVAMALGRVRGTAVVAAYFLEGIAGMPVFAGGTAGAAKLIGPTGGYLVGFLAAAVLTGWLADRGWHKTFVKTVLAMTAGTIVIFMCGLVWLSGFVAPEVVLNMGLTPFIPGALIKISLAAVLLPAIWKSLNRPS